MNTNLFKSLTRIHSVIEDTSEFVRFISQELEIPDYCCILDYCLVHQKFDEEDILPKINNVRLIVNRGGSQIPP